MEKIIRLFNISLGIMICFISMIQQTNAQDFSVGESYFADYEFIEYIHGNLPIILSAPHGGEKKPDEIPDRSCSGCSYINDAFTQELAREITESLFDLTGCYPHVILNRLHRSKLDANRAIIEAADGNLLAEEAWHRYQDYIASSDSSVIAQFNRGLFLDLHGHAHDIQRIEIGYLLSANELRMEDEELDNNGWFESTSIKNLTTSNTDEFLFTEILRGEKSLGSLLYEQGFDAVPSEDDPFPIQGESYFRGGYNTVTNGSSQGGTIDAIQLEHNQDIRFNSSTRKRYADSLAQSLLIYLDNFYQISIQENSCLTSIIELDPNDKLQVFPNPNQGSFKISGLNSKLNYQIKIVNNLGLNIKGFSSQGQNEISIQLGDYNTSFFFLHLVSDEGQKTIKVLLF